MSFPQADTASEDGIGLLLDKVQAEQILDLRPVDLLRPVPLELIERLGKWEAGAADALHQALVLAPGNLSLEHALDGVVVGFVQQVADSLNEPLNISGLYRCQ